MGDGIRKIADRVRGSLPQPKVAKSNRMVVMQEPQFKNFQTYCQAKGVTASAVINQLIAEFMLEAEEDVASTLESAG